MAFDLTDLRVRHAGNWINEPGDYELIVAHSAEDPNARRCISVKFHLPSPEPVHRFVDQIMNPLKN